VPLSTAWFKGVSSEEKEDRARLIRNSIVVDILRAYVEDKLSQEQKVSKSDYDSPSWAFAQADRNGAIRTLNELLLILTIKD
jgi:hypothetical protein